MAEAILSFLLEKVASFAQVEILKAATAKTEVVKLEERLKEIQPFARDAHNKQFVSKEVKEWVWKLNEVAYDALDVIELYRIKARHLAETADSSKSRVRKTLNSIPKFLKEILLRHETGGEIKKINERLDTIYEEKDQYELQPMLKESSSLSENLTVLMQDRQTISAIKETNIIGREEDEEVVIKWLSEESNPDEQQSASVIAILGMGGVGKTALAQNIYHNHSGCFDECMWVCVAGIPNLLDLLKKILEGVQGEGSSLTNPEFISTKIRNHLKGKKFLLVLDDVWDYGWWDGLRSILQDCGSGSKVLITTRQVEVAQAMGHTHSHKLKSLNEEQSWYLLLNKALRSGESEEHLSAVKDVGRNITIKCGGLPLALSVVGSLLRQKERRTHEWQNVLNTLSWNWQSPEENNKDVFGAIALSYMSIPYQLKQCLTYCCMYPKDYEMRKEDLVRLWVVEGFISKEQGEEIEVTAERCLHALVGCSLIQDAGYKRYKLHDIVHDFCLHMREKEYVSMGQMKNESVSHLARYLSSFGEHCSFESLRRQYKLRGLMCQKIFGLPDYNFDAFRWLRVLELSGRFLTELPESIGYLILLKYINLSRTSIWKLPESITKLLELQTLNLSDSTIQALPNRISVLAALRHLDISETSYLEYLPSGIGKLTSLQTLPKFVVGSNTITGGMGSSLLELGELNNLKGSLAIEHLERVDNFEEADHAQIKRKQNLQSLVLECDWECLTELNEDVIEKVEQVYERMQPPTGIEEIRIGGYPGMKCPTWMSSSTYSCLQKISIVKCPLLESLPTLGLLPNLVELHINYVNKVKVLDFTLDEVGEKITFPKLEALTLKDMDSLEEWQFNAEIGNMPCLCRLDIDLCPKLKVIPSFSTLEHLIVSGMFEWEGWFLAKERDMPCLKTMKVSFCHKLKLLPNCPRLEEMSITSCAQVVELPRLSPVLVRAMIKWCCSISCIQNIDAAKELEHLEIVACPNLQLLPPGLQCGHLKTLVIKECSNLASIPTAQGLEVLELGDTLGSLQVQELVACLAVTRLRRLKLSGFQELGVEWLRSKIRDMVQLKELAVEDCLKARLSIIDVLKEHALPNLQYLGLTSRIPSPSERSYGCKLHLSCVLVIDSVEISNKLAGLMLHLSSKVRSLAVSMQPGVDLFPEWIQQLPLLERLNVYKSPQLTHLPPWLNKLPQLSMLNLVDLPELVELPALLQLDSVGITRCPKLNYSIIRAPSSVTSTS